MTRCFTVSTGTFVNFSTNGLVFQLPLADQVRLQDICQPVALSEGQILCLPEKSQAAKVYFLTGACVTLWVQNPGQPSLAVGLIGSEGAVGLGAALRQNPRYLRFEVQSPGPAWCADSLALQRLLQSQPALLWTVARYLWQMTHDMAQMAAAIQCDDIPTRLAAWLVLCAQRANTPTLRLTHDQLAHMLGVRRVSVTLAAAELKKMGLLNYSRGVIDIMDMVRLAQLANTRPRARP